MRSGSDTILSWVLSIMVGVVVGWIALTAACIVVGLLMMVVAPGETKTGTCSEWWGVLSAMLSYLLAWSWSGALGRFGANTRVVGTSAVFTILLLTIGSSIRKSIKKRDALAAQTSSVCGTERVVATTS